MHVFLDDLALANDADRIEGFSKDTTVRTSKPLLADSRPTAKKIPGDDPSGKIITMGRSDWTKLNNRKAKNRPAAPK